MMRRLFSLLMLAVCLGSLYGCFAGLQEDAPVAPQVSSDASIQATADSEPLTEPITEPITESITDPITEPSAEPVTVPVGGGGSACQPGTLWPHSHEGLPV